MRPLVQSCLNLATPLLNIWAVRSSKDKDIPSISPAILSHPAPHIYPPVMLVARAAVPRKTLRDGEEYRSGLAEYMPLKSGFLQ